MNIYKRLSKLEDSKRPARVPFIRVLIETDGTCQVLGSEKTFQSEQAFDRYYKNKPVNIIKRPMVD